MIHRLKRLILKWMIHLSLPSKAELVRNLVLNTANLELKPKEIRRLAPAPHCYGTVLLSGAALPVIEYTVFDQELMDFVQVRVEVGLPHHIRFLPTLLLSDEKPPAHPNERDAVGLAMHTRTLIPTPLKEEYEKPFYFLAQSFYHYFPLQRGSEFHETKTLKEAIREKDRPAALSIDQQGAH